MKLFVTKMTEKGSIVYYKIDEKGKNTKSSEYEKFSSEFLANLSTKGEIYDTQFLDANILRIEYLNSKNALEAVTIYFAEDVLETENFKKIYNSVEAFQDRKDGNMECIGKTISTIDEAKSLLIRFVQSGCVLDASTSKEAKKVFENMILQKDAVLQDLKLPLSQGAILKKFSLLLGSVAFVPYYVGWVIVYALGITTMFDFFPGPLSCVLGVFGPGALSFISSLYYKDFQKDWNLKIWNYFISQYEHTHDIFLEGKKDIKSLPEKEIKDPFIRFIICDIDYIRKQNAADYASELQRLSDLIARYRDDKRREMVQGVSVEMDSFMTELTDIELSMFSKNRKVGLNRTNSELIKEAFVTDRLKYIGVEEGYDANDKYLSFIFEQVRRITVYPYEGCEKDLVELYKIAADYVKAKNGDQISLTLETPEKTLIQKETAIELEITRKIKACERAEALADDMEELERVMGLAQAQLQETKDADAKSFTNKPKEEQ